MRTKLLTGMGFLLLAGFCVMGFFGASVGLFVCAVLGICFGISGKDRWLVNGSLVALAVAIALLVYIYALIQSM